MFLIQHACEDHLEQATRDRRPVTVREVFLPKSNLSWCSRPVARVQIPRKVGQRSPDAGVHMPETSKAAKVVAIMGKFQVIFFRSVGTSAAGLHTHLAMVLNL